MKFCEKCGKEIMDEAVICPGCGCSVNDRSETVKVMEVPKQAKTAKLLGILSYSFVSVAWYSCDYSCY